MHSLARRFIKSGIAFLFAGLLLGAWMLWRREATGAFPSRYLVSAHAHLVGVGFVMQMILGVALWLFPRPASSDTRYRPQLVAVAWWLVTAGTMARAFGEMLRAYGSIDAPSAVFMAGGLAQLIGLPLFFITMWSRIRAVGSRLREERGERF